MPAYFVAQIEIHDPDGYQNYLKGFMEKFDCHGGKLRATSTKPITIVEGDWPLSSVVLMEFPDLGHARAWKDEPDYQALAIIRENTTKMILIDGI